MHERELFTGQRNSTWYNDDPRIVASRTIVRRRLTDFHLARAQPMMQFRVSRRWSTKDVCSLHASTGVRTRRKENPEWRRSRAKIEGRGVGWEEAVGVVHSTAPRRRRCKGRSERDGKVRECTGECARASATEKVKQSSRDSGEK